MLKAEIADTPRALEKGLMFRKKLADDDGMLFVFDKPQRLNFWGRNTYLPLDIAFIDEEGVIKKVSHISPLSEKPISSDHECIMAIETNMGYFSEKCVKPGNKVSIDKLSDKIATISFHDK